MNQLLDDVNSEKRFPFNLMAGRKALNSVEHSVVRAFLNHLRAAEHDDDLDWDIRHAFRYEGSGYPFSSVFGKSKVFVQVFARRSPKDGRAAQMFQKKRREEEERMDAANRQRFITPRPRLLAPPNPFPALPVAPNVQDTPATSLSRRPSLLGLDDEGPSCTEVGLEHEVVATPMVDQSQVGHSPNVEDNTIREQDESTDAKAPRSSMVIISTPEARIIDNDVSGISRLSTKEAHNDSTLAESSQPEVKSTSETDKDGKSSQIFASTEQPVLAPPLTPKSSTQEESKESNDVREETSALPVSSRKPVRRGDTRRKGSNRETRDIRDPAYEWWSWISPDRDASPPFQGITSIECWLYPNQKSKDDTTRIMDYEIVKWFQKQPPKHKNQAPIAGLRLIHRQIAQDQSLFPEAIFDEMNQQLALPPIYKHQISKNSGFIGRTMNAHGELGRSNSPKNA